MASADFLGLELWELFFGMTSIIAGGFLRGFLGFGSALLIIPMLTIILTPVEAVVIFMLIELPNVAYLLPLAFRDFDSKSVSVMVFGLVLTVPVGTYVLVSVNTSAMKITISTIVLLLVGLIASGWKVKRKINRFVMFGTGLVGGIVHGAAGVGGPPFITLLLSRGDNPQRTRANIVMTLNCLSIMGAITLFAFGAISIELVYASCLASPIYILFTAIGARYFKISGNNYFKRAALVVLSIIAIMMIYSALD